MSVLVIENSKVSQVTRINLNIMNYTKELKRCKNNSAKTKGTV